MRKDGSVDCRQTAQSDAKIYLHMDSGESEETQIDLVNIAGHMNPNLPKLLYIGFKLIPQIPYKIGV